MSVPDGKVLACAAIAGATGVAIGAFGAHGLSEFLEAQGAEPDLIAKRLSQFDTGTRYHLVHAVVLLALSVLDMMPRGDHAESASAGINHAAVRRTAILFLSGICLFSGSLYLLVLTNTPWLGAVTPLGGVAWILAWISLLFCRSKKS